MIVLLTVYTNSRNKEGNGVISIVTSEDIENMPLKGPGYTVHVNVTINCDSDNPIL